VPFYLRTGKRLARRASEIAIQFHCPPHVLFRNTPVPCPNPNLPVLRIQPEEGISLRFEAKVPGPVVRLGAVNMDFRYADYFGNRPSTGYERLLHDCMIGDATLFQRADMVEQAWAVVMPVLEAWQAAPCPEFPNYPAGSWGGPGKPTRCWGATAGSGGRSRPDLRGIFCGMTVASRNKRRREPHTLEDTCDELGHARRQMEGTQG
jgi:glucose-6-phosphate 1-dehydrogenase